MSRIVPIIIIIIFFFCICRLPVQAQLTFERPDYAEKTTPKQRTVEAAYAFKNSGDYPIKIEGIRSSCGCTTTELKKKLYQPGEAGKLKVALDVPMTPGEHIKHVYIRTDEPKDRRTYELTIGAKVKEYVRIDPRYLRWEHAETPDPKTLTLQNVHDAPIHVTDVEVSNPNWTLRLETVKDGQEYKIHITPPEDTTRISRVALKIKTDFPDDDSFVFRANARVARKRERPKTNWLLELFR